VNAVLLSLHVLAAIVLIGPITVAASVFPRYARAAAADSSGALAVAGAMHRISLGYSLPAIAVPALGVGLASSMGVLTEVWLVVSMVLTALAAVLLVTQVNPTQARVLSSLRAGRTVEPALLGRLSMVTGIFALLWAVVVVLMVARPGSSTGV
jgi:hypothetical protein